MKMNFNDYVNPLTYPSKKNFTSLVPFVFPSGRKGEEKIFDEEAYHSAMNDYWNEESRLNQKFKSDLKKHLGIEGNPKADLLLDKAWELGHASGYSGVTSFTEELVELIQ